MFLMDLLITMFVQLSNVVGPTFGTILGFAILIAVIVIVVVFLKWFTDKFLNL